MIQQLTRQVEIPGFEYLAGPYGLKQSVMNRDEALEMHEDIIAILGMDADEYYRLWSEAWSRALKAGPKSTW